MFKKIAAAILMASTLAACATQPNPLNAEAREGVFVKTAEIAWTLDPKAAAREAKAKPEYFTYKEEIAKRLPLMLEEEFRTSPSGSQAVTFRVKVTNFGASTLGGAVYADVDVVRVSDGEVLGTYKKIYGAQVASGGLIGLAVQAAIKPDVIGIMSQTFAQNLRARFVAAK